ncbi:MAG: nitrogenase component 1 [Coriobacteriia bacterium]|nr:nitrogenase component 1 [Coriobacteriia bacterium]
MNAEMLEAVKTEAAPEGAAVCEGAPASAGAGAAGSKPEAVALPPELRHLKRLSTIRSGKNIKFLTPAVYSGGWCPMRIACNICEDIEGLSYLLVGMPECATHSRGMNSSPNGQHGELRWLYTLDANEVIFGCHAGVADALRQMDAAGARAVLIIATCVTDLIGEDLEGIIEEVSPDIQARLSYVTLGQFKNFGSPIGTWKTAEAIGELMGPQAVQPGTANALFVEPWRYNNDPVRLPLVIDALIDAGVQVRRLTRGASLDDYLAAPSAQLNLVLSAYTQPLAQKMEERFGLPYAPLHQAFSVEKIDLVYEQAAAAFGVTWSADWASRFDRWRERALQLEERAQSELAGLRFAFLTGVDMPVALALYLASFGMEPLVLHVQDFHNEDIAYSQELKSLGFDPPICRIMHRDHDIEVIRRLQPDISFGYVSEPIEGFRVSEEMGDYFGMTGYERTVSLLTRLFNVLDTGQTGERMDVYGPTPF